MLSVLFSSSLVGLETMALQCLVSPVFTVGPLVTRETSQWETIQSVH